MLALVKDGGAVRLERVPVPTLSDDDVLVRVCSSARASRSTCSAKRCGPS
jgi:hypothetical protein